MSVFKVTVLSGCIYSVPSSRYYFPTFHYLLPSSCRSAIHLYCRKSGSSGQKLSLVFGRPWVQISGLRLHVLADVSIFLNPSSILRGKGQVKTYGGGWRCWRTHWSGWVELIAGLDDLEKKKKKLAPTGYEPRFLSSTARTLVTVPIEETVHYSKLGCHCILPHAFQFISLSPISNCKRR